MSAALNVLSLFAGVGGFDLAFERAGARVKAAVEINPAARTVLARRFPNTILFNDVTEVTADDVRATGFVADRGILTAGFPCQDISIAGRRVGLAGARSGLFWEIVRILADVRPVWFVLENVPNLLSVNGGRDMGAVLGAVGQLGYGFAYRVLDAQYFGVPQRRRRVFIVGHLGEPFGAPAEVLFECESCAGDHAARGETWPPVALAYSRRAAEAGVNDRIVAPLLSERRGVPSVDEADQLVVGALLARGSKGVDSDGNGIVAQYAPHLAAPLTAGSAAKKGVNPPGRRQEDDVNIVATDTMVRRLTPLEYERLQGFPDGWTAGQADSPRYKQMGNSLAVPVVEWIARRLVAVDGRVA